MKEYVFFKLEFIVLNRYCCVCLEGGDNWKENFFCLYEKNYYIEIWNGRRWNNIKGFEKEV